MHKRQLRSQRHLLCSFPGSSRQSASFGSTVPGLMTVCVCTPHLDVRFARFLRLQVDDGIGDVAPRWLMLRDIGALVRRRVPLSSRWSWTEICIGNSLYEGGSGIRWVGVRDPERGEGRGGGAVQQAEQCWLIVSAPCMLYL